MREKRAVKRRMSLKLKLTLWLAVCMLAISGLCLGLILMMSGRMSRREAYRLLETTVREMVPETGLRADGRVALGENFSFYKNGVYLLLYHENGSLLSGQVPPDFPVKEPLENGVKQTVSGQSESFFVFDLWVPSGWEDGLWLRGVVQKEGAGREAAAIIGMFAAIFPFVILSAVVGGYLIARRAMEPMERIIKAADSISEGKDLSRRIDTRESTDEAGRLAGAFNRMFARLEEAFETERQFASDASHELRTPTAVILAQCAYLEKYASEPEEYKEGIEVISRQGQRMSSLIERLLDMTRLEFGTRKLKLERTNLSDMLEALCAEYDTGVRDIALEAELEPNITVKADPHLLWRAVGNLLDNARKYGKEGGHIWVTLKKEPDSDQETGSGSAAWRAVLTVKDDGIGIGPEHLEKIWKRFYQVSGSREDGAGLGLSMVRQIIELHGGLVSAESHLGEGSMFTVILKEDDYNETI